MLISLAVAGIGMSLDARNTAQHQQGLRKSVAEAGSRLARQIAYRMDSHAAAATFLGHLLLDADFRTDDIQHATKKYLDDRPDLALFAVAPNFELRQTVFRNEQSATTQGVELNRLAADVKSMTDRSRTTIITGTQNGKVTLVVPIRKSSAEDAPIWGAIAAVVDAQKLVDEVDTDSVSNGNRAKTSLGWLDLAVRDTAKPDDLAFIGDDGIGALTPLTWFVPITGGSWYLQAAPRAGWTERPPNQNGFRLGLLLAALAIVAPIFMVSSLIAQRNRNIAELKAREAKLLELSQRFSLAMEASNIGIWQIAEDGHHLFWDDRAASLHDMPASADSRLDDWMSSIVLEDRAEAEEHFFKCTCAGVPASHIYRVKTEGGGYRYLRSAGAGFKTANGSVRTTGIVWDVTADMTMTQTLRDAKEHADIKNAELELALDELSRREQDLEDLSNKLDLALASYGCGIWEVDLSTGIERWDERMCQLYSIPYGDGIISRAQWLEMMLPEDRAAACRTTETYSKGDTDEPLVVRVPQPDGSLRYIRSFGKLQVDRAGRHKLIGIALDVTADALLTAELKAAKEEADAKNAELELAKTRIEHNALHDPLTMLANRRKLDIQLDLLSRSSQQERQKFSILHLDLDRFKQINDTLGHAAGDAMLVHASRILSRNVRGSDLVARIGGDEFVIVAMGSSSAEEMAQLSQRIIREFHQPISFEGFSSRCGISIGIAHGVGANLDARRVLVNADIALYRAKSHGRNRYEFFTPNLQAEIISQKRTADELLAGLDQGEFVAWYQPQFDARTNQLSGMEALIRWQHPHQGILTPDRFLKIAEDLNLSAALDQVVLENVLNDKLRWIAQGIVMPKVSVNVSSKRLHDDRLIETLRNLAIAPGEIVFELVESIFLDESEEQSAGNLEQIKSFGIDIEIDDFGTGHTSIVSLLKLKPKRLKIDRQLVIPIVRSPQERALVRSIIEIARSLGVETVAEGVETMQHAALLRDLGCDHLQGYAFARPLPFHNFTEAALAGWQRLVA